MLPKTLIIVSKCVQFVNFGKRGYRMGIWMDTLLLNLLIPIVIWIIGILYLKRPSENINWTHGYRTKRSMKNQETWEYAQRHFGGVCCRWGIGFATVILLLMISVIGMSEKTIRTIGSMIGTSEGFLMAYLLVPTERALKKKYGM